MLFSLGICIIAVYSLSDSEVQNDIKEIKQILEHSKAKQHVIVNSKENIKSSIARLTLPALSHF